MQSTGGWSNVDWETATSPMRLRGWLADTDQVILTEWRTAQRLEIEDQSNHLAAAPYTALGEESCAELRTLTRPSSKAFSEVLFR